MPSTADATRQVSGAPALSLTGLELESIAPSHGAKYSPNLFEFLSCRRNRLGFAARARVFSDARQRLWLGFFDDVGMFVGARLNQVLCYGKKTEVNCPVNLGPLAEVVDFWARYVADGRCAIDTEHTTAFLNDESRWAIEGNTRSCRWCGRVTQKLFTRLVSSERTSWKNVEHTT